MNTEFSNKNLNFNKTCKVLADCFNENSANKPLLNIFSWNIHCLTQRKLNVIKQYLDEWTRSSISKDHNNFKSNYPTNISGFKRNYCIDIIALTETWLRDDSKLNVLSIRYYNKFFINRCTGTKGGGILLFVHNSHHATVIDSTTNDDIEYLLLKILLNGEEWFILTVYKPPNGSLTSFLKHFESSILLTNVDKLIITGDMNLNIMDANNLATNEYLDTISSLNLSILNSAITRHNYFSPAAGSIIDHFIANKMFNNYIVLTSTKIQQMSDHNFLLLLVQMEHVEPKRKRLIKKKVDNKAVICDLKEYLSDYCFNPDDNAMESNFINIHSLITQSICDHTSITQIKVPSHIKTVPPWLDDRYMEMLRTLHNLEEKIDEKKINKAPYSQLELKYNDLNIIRENYAHIKSKIYYKKLVIANRHQAWIVINQILGRKNIKNTVVINGRNNEFLTDHKQIADAFQDKFLSIVGKQPIDITRHRYLGSLVQNTFCLDEISPFTIFTIIGSLENKKAVGYDKVHAGILKGCNKELCVHLANIFNQMVRQGKYPENLKHSIVTPILKTGDPSSVDNYRPISVLSQIDKIFEIILCTQITNFLESNGVLDPLQYGFTNKKGCPDIICMTLNHISRFLDQGVSVIVISLDIKKAFDSVIHKILLRKLNFMGFRDKALELIESFLTGRTQAVKFADVLSYIGLVLLGVPQGSNLGPLLFNLLINDLSSLITHASLYKYADDLLIIFPLNKNGENLSALKTDLKLIFEYYEQNGLNVNAQKSQFMIFGKIDDDIRDFLVCQNFIETMELKYLGFLIDCELKLPGQIQHICKSISSGISALNNLRDHVPQETLIRFFHSDIQSHINYCSFALLRARSIDIDRIQRLQSKALRIIFNLPYSYPSCDLFTKEAKHILPVTGLIYFTAICMTKKCLRSKDNSLPKVEQLKSKRKHDVLLAISSYI